MKDEDPSQLNLDPLKCLDFGLLLQCRHGCLDLRKKFRELLYRPLVIVALHTGHAAR
jgi:hypothetical protein